jgi:Response regulator containing a CheY-like receiver domain and an HD-GYP domain
MRSQGAGYNSSILIAFNDQNERNRTAELFSEDGFRTSVAATGEEVLSLAAGTKLDLILMDIVLNGVDGIETVRQLKDDERTSTIPVILFSPSEKHAVKLNALQAGAEDVLVKPFDSAELLARMRNLLRLKEYGDFLTYYNESLNKEIQERTTRLEEAYRETLVTLVRASEFRDEDTGFHINRIGRYTCALAELLGLDDAFVKTILLASLMHDVGKIGIPDSILLKHDQLTAEETDIMHTHCMLGAKILRDGDSRYLVMGAEIALSHHERWDGSGYPQRLAGTAIPLSARITQIADVYDALRSRRPYKPPIDHEVTMRILHDGDGRTMPSHFDPDIFAVFLDNSDVFDSIYNSSHEVTSKKGTAEK